MSSDANRPGRVRLVHVPGAMLVLGVVRLGLRCLGFGRCMALADRLLQRRVGTRRPAPDEISLVLGDVAVAAAFFPGRSLCLEQSLAVYVLLGRRGFPVRLRLGVQPFPFTAHAWVECDGRPVNESDEFVKHFSLLPAATR